MIKMPVRQKNLFNCQAVFPYDFKQFVCLRARINDKAMLSLIIDIEKTVLFKIPFYGNLRYHSLTLYGNRPVRSSYPVL